MVTPSLTVLGELLSLAFFFSLTLTFLLSTHKHGHKQTCRPTENVDILYSVCADRNTYMQRQRLSVYELRIIAIPVL